MKSLRTQFVFKAVLTFFIILVVLFAIFATLMHAFFINTVTVLDQMESELVAEDVNMRLSEYRNGTEALAKNANLVDMLATCPTPEAFNTDHNFPLIVESMARIQQDNTSLWVFNIQSEYQIQSGVGRAKWLKITEKDRALIRLLSEKMTDTLLVEYAPQGQNPMFNVVTPIQRGGKLIGLAGTSIDLEPLLHKLQEVSAINNMSTECTLLIPQLDESMQVLGYTEASLNSEGQMVVVQHKADYPEAFTDGAQQVAGNNRETRGEKHLSAVGSTNWYVSLFVTEATINSAFLGSYLTIGVWTFVVFMLVSLSLVALMAFHLTRPIHELDTLVANISGGKPYQRLKGNNEVTRAADSLIDLVNDDRALLADIKVMAKKIALGEIFTRFRDSEVEPTQHEIKASLNEMLDSISYILDHLPLGVAVLDEDYQLLYLNGAIRELLEIDSNTVGQQLHLNQLHQLSEANRRVIARGIDDCRSGAQHVNGKLLAMQRHLELTTVRLDTSGNGGLKQVFLQVFLNQTAVTEKVKEQEQIFAYFEHLSLVKKEALKWLSKGNFNQAIIEIGQRPSAPYLQEIYDNQLEMKRAFQDTVGNVEAIITQMQEATTAFASGDLHATINAQSAKGQYSNLAKTANTAFHVILSYFQAIPVPIRIIDPNYHIVFSNEASTRNGFCEGEGVLCYHWFGRDEHCCSCPYSDKTTELTVRELTLERDGRSTYWRAYRNPLLDEGGNIVSMLEILIDETKIVELRKAADSANVAKSTFIASMSHEIRTPMNAILGYSQLLEMNQSLGTENRNYVEIIKHSGNHLLGLINDILELSKIEAGKIQINPEPFDLLGLLAEVQSMFLPQIEAKGLRLLVEAKQIHQHLIGDVGKIRQILINLVSNALKFTCHGEIIICAGSEEMDDGHIRIVIDVSDTGKGISLEEQGRVFHAFEQTETGVKSGAGTGLGMSISRNFAILMEGTLDILDSQVGKGTTFRLVLVLGASREQTTQPASHRRYGGICGLQAPKTVLIVETAADNRTLLQRILEKMGFTVLCAEGNTAALQLWHKHAPDAITTDFSNGGLALIRAIRAEDPKRNTPVIVITASAMQQDKEAALQAGADHYLTKPLVVEALAGVLEKLAGATYLFHKESAPSVGTRNATGYETLTYELQNQVRQAVLQGDFDTVTIVADSIVAACPALSARLTELADDFDKDGICNLLDALGKQ